MGTVQASITNDDRVVSAEEYDAMSFEHDADFVEGRVVERSMPNFLHALMQYYVCRMLDSLNTGMFALTEQRLLISASRRRIPDVCLTAELPRKSSYGLLREPPFLCVEIASEGDEMSELWQKVGDYLGIGVDYVWVIFPETYTGVILTSTTTTLVSDGIFRAGDKITVDAKADPQRARWSEQAPA